MRYLIVIALVLLVGCRGGDAPAPSDRQDTTVTAGPDVAPVETSQGRDDAATGSALTVSAESEFNIELDVNPSTGYHWVLSGIEPTGVVEQSGEPVFLADSSHPGRVGEMGTQVWTFLAREPGDAVITMELIPPGEGRPAARSREIQVTVE